jgi:trans-aconitate methyltransferase
MEKMMAFDRQAFDAISGDYQKKALVQQQAGLRLINLLQITSKESVLDVGCGPGHLTYALTKSTRGRVVGVDISAGMIAKAQILYPGLDFRQSAAEDLAYQGIFHVGFCNSAFQWFTQPDKALQAIYTCLKPNGRLGLATPATMRWAPWLQAVLEEVVRQPDISPVYEHWKSPWLFLPDEDDYQALFERNGFATTHLELVHEQKDYSIQDAYDIYLSGAANGLLGPQFYDTEISRDYVDRFNLRVRENIEKKANQGRIIVDFNRLYYIGKKQGTP